jgi:hypothetical protein
MISIGVVNGGPECLAFSVQLRKLGAFCHGLDWNPADEFGINLVYHLPGSVLKPDFIEIEESRLSKKRRLLMIMIAVEEEFLTVPQHEMLNYIYETADEAIGVAKSRLDRARLSYEMSSDRQRLDEWRASVLE